MMAQDTETAAPSVRDAVEAAYASNSIGSDAGSVIHGAVEQRDHQIRTRDRAAPSDRWQHESDSSYRRRSDVRNSLYEKMREAAAGPTQPARKHEAQPGPPQGFDLIAKGQWHDLPQETRLAYQREQAQTLNALESNIAPRLREHAELDRVIAPSRAVFQQYGVKSDAEAVQRLFEWEHSLRVDPHGGIQRLAHQLGIDLRQLVGGSSQQYAQHDPAQQMQDQQQAQAVHQHLAQFSQGKPHFEAVRYTMGVLLQTRGEKYALRDGSFDLEKAYREACRIEGVGDNRSRHTVSPPSRSPAVRHDTSQHSGGGSVRNSIMSAVRQSRGG